MKLIALILFLTYPVDSNISVTTVYNVMAYDQAAVIINDQLVRCLCGHVPTHIFVEGDCMFAYCDNCITDITQREE